MQIKALYFPAGQFQGYKERFIETATNDEFYKLIKTDTIDIVQREFSGKRYCLVIDDLARLREKRPPASVLTKDFKVDIFGNVVFTGLPNYRGELTSLTDDEISNLINHISLFFEEATNQAMQCMVEY